MSNTLTQKQLTKSDLIKLRDNAARSLGELITEEGIFASDDNGWSGPYHSWFGRDSAITADLVCSSLRFGGDEELVKKAQKGLLALAEWQGKKNNPETGEELGKIPHEIRKDLNDIHKVQHARGTNEEPWFIDPNDGILKNWDSADSTPLWVIAVVHTHRALNTRYSDSTLEALRLALGWILSNLQEFGGFVGFVGAGEVPGRKYSGLHNQGWKDTYQVYQNTDGTLSPHPIKDVLVNAESWAALRLGAGVFDATDKSFADSVNKAASELKRRFNDSDTGFLMPEISYFAQAIDGKGKRLSQVAVDVPMCLWAFYGGESILSGLYVDDVAKRAVDNELFNPEAGIRNYALGTKFDQGTLYHGSPYTFWPFASALVARGLQHFSYWEEAFKVIKAYLAAVNHFGTNVEMFMENPDTHRLEPWQHPQVDQQSSTEQAWTAAAVYYGSLVLLRS